MADLSVGTRFGPYTIERLLGRGGMSVVYLAEDSRLGRRVALKVLASDAARDESFRSRFLAESRMAALLEHPNIVPIHEAGETEGRLYIAMRYVRGTDLASLLDQEGPLEPQRAVSVIEQVASALDAAHAEGLVHRDVKPANVLLAPGTERDLVYLSDFGVTRRTSGPRGPTATGQFLGTVEYAAPEQFEGRPVDARTDVYALGCVLYECLTGEPPFPREEQVAVMYAHLNEPPPSVTARRPGIPAGIDSVVARAMAKPPPDRYPTAGALAADAARALAPAREVQGSPRRTRRGAVLSVAALAALAVGLAIVVALMSGDDPGARTTLPAGSPTGATTPTGATSPTPAPGLEVPSDAVVRLDARRIAPPLVVEGVLAGESRVNPPAHITMAVGEGAVWVFSAPPGRLVHIDRSSRLVESAKELSAQLGTGTYRMAVGFRTLWIAALPGLRRINPATDRELRPVDFETDPQFLFGQPTDVAIGGGAVWGSGTDGTVFRVQPLQGRVTGQVVTGDGTDALAFAAGSLWVLNRLGEEVVRVDPSTLDVRTRISVNGDLVDIAGGDEGVWVLDRSAGTVIPIEIEGDTAGTPIRVGGQPAAIDVGLDAVWVVDAGDGSLYRVDPLLREAAITPVGTPLGAVVVDEGTESIWIAPRAE